MAIFKSINWIFHPPKMKILLVIFLVNMFLLMFGVFMSWLDIRLFGAGLYLALVSCVTLVIVLAFCLVGTDEQVETYIFKNSLICDFCRLNRQLQNKCGVNQDRRFEGTRPYAETTATI